MAAKETEPSEEQKFAMRLLTTKAAEEMTVGELRTVYRACWTETQAAFARDFGVDESGVSRWLAGIEGRNSPSCNTSSACRRLVKLLQSEMGIAPQRQSSNSNPPTVPDFDEPPPPPPPQTPPQKAAAAPKAARASPERKGKRGSTDTATQAMTTETAATNQPRKGEIKPPQQIDETVKKTIAAAKPRHRDTVVTATTAPAETAALIEELERKAAKLTLENDRLRESEQRASLIGSRVAELQSRLSQSEDQRRRAEGVAVAAESDLAKNEEIRRAAEARAAVVENQLADCKRRMQEISEENAKLLMEIARIDPRSPAVPTPPKGRTSLGGATSGSFSRRGISPGYSGAQRLSPHPGEVISPGFRAGTGPASPAVVAIHSNDVRLQPANILLGFLLAVLMMAIYKISVSSQS